MKIKLSKIKVTLPGSGRTLFSINDYEISFGSKTLIYGPSGKGKTTLLHLIAGLFLPDAGSVFIGDNELTSFSDEERSLVRRNHIGIVFQKLNMLDHLTALENVVVGLNANDKNKYLTAEKALNTLGLGQYADERSSNLSQGEQQRVAIARVIAAKPDIILADEPTSSLDELNANKVMNSLYEVSQNKTLIVVSHDFRMHEKFKNKVNFSELISK